MKGVILFLKKIFGGFLNTKCFKQEDHTTRSEVLIPYWWEHGARCPLGVHNLVGNE